MQKLRSPLSPFFQRKQSFKPIHCLSLPSAHLSSSFTYCEPARYVRINRFYVQCILTTSVRQAIITPVALNDLGKQQLPFQVTSLSQGQLYPITVVSRTCFICIIIRNKWVNFQYHLKETGESEGGKHTAIKSCQPEKNFPLDSPY